jgi:dynein heavy chain, axonemal
MQVLDDHSMNLQSMSASPFIGPFMNSVQKWEKCLTLVYEIVDEWLATQRKWLYLEGENAIVNHMNAMYVLQKKKLEWLG